MIKSTGQFFSSRLFCILVGVCLIATSFILWTAQRQNDLSQIQAQTDSRSRSYASETETRYHNIHMALQRMAERRVPEDVVDIDAWEKDAAFFTESVAGIKTISWVDSDFRIRRIVPSSSNELYIGRMANEGMWGPSEVNLWLPIYSGAELAGFIVGTVDIGDFALPIVTDIENDYMIRLTDGDREIFASQNWGIYNQELAAHSTVTLQDTVVWNLSLAPTKELVDSVAADSMRTLLFGLALSIMTTMAVFLAQTSTRKSIFLERNKADLEASNMELERKRNELRDFSVQLEQQVVVRTAELKETNMTLQAEIVERKRAEDEVRRLNASLERRVRKRTEELEASNKDLEAFAYSVSHDLRAPLRAIDGFSNILLEEYTEVLDTEGRRLLGIVRGNTARMDRLITELLELARVGRNNMNRVPVDMAAMARTSFVDAASAEERATFDFSVGEMPTATGDPTLLGQAWHNLLANAVKFTLPSETHRIEVGGYADATETTFFVRDTGVGFDSKYGNKLFGVFQRLHSHEQFEGTGIGLAIVHRIMYRHGGRVWAEGATGSGATFYFALPRGDEAIDSSYK